MPASRTIPLPTSFPAGSFFWEMEGAFKVSARIGDADDDAWVLSADGRSLVAGGSPRRQEDDSFTEAAFMAEARRRAVSKAAS